MPDAMHLAAINTLLAVLLTFALGGRVGIMRARYRIEAPACVGHPDFERAFRVHSNTVENVVLMIPLLWIASVYYGGQLPFWIGLAWVGSRIIYAVGYAQKNTQLRAPGAGIGILCLLVLLILGALGVAS